MANTLIAVDLNLTTDVRIDFTTQVTFDLVITLEVITQLDELLVSQILDADIWRDSSRCECLFGASAAYTEDVGQSHFNALIVGDVDSTL